MSLTQSSMERREATSTYRVVAVRTERRFFYRWHWTIEEKHYDGWELRKEGLAFRMRGALERAHNAIFPPPDLERMEALIVHGWSYVPNERKPPSPLEPELIP